MDCLKNDKGYLFNAHKGVEAFNIELNNSSGTLRTYSVFDTSNFVGQVVNKTPVNPSGGTINPLLIGLSTASNPIYIKGFNYQVSNPAQFSQKFEYIRVELDSTFRIFPINTSELLSNMQFDTNLLTIDEKMYFDLKSAIFIDVLPGTNVSITFFVDKIVNLPCNCQF